MIVILAIYIYLTLSNPFFKNFNHDEIHAWNIASNFNFIDIIRLMRSEGHTFIWFMLMKPFGGGSIFAIKWLNWTFTFSAVLLMWNLAPFRIQEKILITFTAPFLLIYPVIARCYGIGLLLLFIMVILYKYRHRHPVWFSITVFLAANTSIMAAIPALTLGLIFGCELIKNRKDFISMLILILTPLSLYVQWHNPIIPFYSTEYVFSKRATEFFFGFFRIKWGSYFAYIIYPAVIISSIMFFKQNKKFLFFLFFSWFGLFSLLAFVYCGFDYHFYFFYIYLILAYWMNGNSVKYKKVFSVFFILLSMLYCFKRVGNEWLSKTYYTVTAKCIASIVERDTVIYTTLFDHNILLPYLDGIILKDYDGKPLVSFENFSKIYASRIPLDYNKLYNIAQPESYLLINAKKAQDAGLDFSDKTRYRECGADILYRIK